MIKNTISTFCASFVFMSSISIALFSSGCSESDVSPSQIYSQQGQKYQNSIETIEQFARTENRRNSRTHIGGRTKWVRIDSAGQPLQPVKSQALLGVPTPDLQARLIRAINAKRGEFGLSSLKSNSKLMAAAQGYARTSAQRGDIEHIGKDGSTPGDRATDAGYRWKFIAENLAAGQDSVPLTIEDWMNSPSHRDALLSTEPVDIGVGHHTDPSDPKFQQYWVMLVGTPR